MPKTFLRLPDVVARTGLSRSTIYLRRKHKNFPEPAHLGGRAVGWLESEIEEWMDQQLEERNKIVN